jgi:hypothetical protein
MAICGIIHSPMSKKTATELEILFTAYNDKPTAQNAARLISTLRVALDTSERDRIVLEKDIRKLEQFLSGKNPCDE